MQEQSKCPKLFYTWFQILSDSDMLLAISYRILGYLILY